MSDIIALFFFFFLIYFFTEDLLTSLMGSFSIYLWIGVAELKDYPVINKILVISLVTYNVIFISGLISAYFNDPFLLNTSFAFSFWIILILGFILFGRKYIVVWRFMSPQYLTLFLYLLGWIGVVFINQYTPIDFYRYIYLVLIIVNVLIYFSSGYLLDKLLGIKRIKDAKIAELVQEVKKNLNIKGRVKVGFGQYPILNAMAYGSFFDKRIAIIAESLDNLPEDELKGIVAHELAHTKGNHTFILALITIMDLIIRWIFGFPATYYDYTFGNPQIPFILFLGINLGIYIVLYFFVRILEGYADRRAKTGGYGQELVKALYNLESFYASGREIGLNTMLLCDEKISRENKMLDYVSTAQYINQSMIKPSKLSLLGNFLNSHPPTYHRILAILGDEINPYKETLLPLLYLREKNQRKFAQKYYQARKDFQTIANQKFKEFFRIEDISQFLNNLEPNEKYKYDFQKSFLFRNMINGEYKYGKLITLKIKNDISDKFCFKIFNHISKKSEFLNPSHFTKTQVNIGDHYIFSNDNLLTLEDIHFDNDSKSGFYIFTDENNNRIKKSIKKTKIPISIEKIQNFLNNDVFLKRKGVLETAECTALHKKDNLNESKIELKNLLGENGEAMVLTLQFKDLILKPKNIQFEIKKKESNIENSKKILEWISNKEIRAYFYLKKPVNNIEIGYIEK
ncbi:MAG: M48 family metalloprotease, partial [Candidatus Lokiarchaeota archaeon]|nr:M48 family metalloprotease [Candidatus Lokiarchaeota archaeon]